MKNVTMHPRNGNGNGNGVRGAERYQLSRTFTETSTVQVFSVVSTPRRVIDLLEHQDGLFTIRETEYAGEAAGGVSVQHIRLYRHELEHLHTILGAALREPKDPQSLSEERERA
jgi:hypothetical protein